MASNSRDNAHVCVSPICVVASSLRHGQILNFKPNGYEKFYDVAVRTERKKIAKRVLKILHFPSIIVVAFAGYKRCYYPLVSQN